ncbi:MAG: BatA domain-containing protein [Flavobacteriales bacterium]
MKFAYPEFLFALFAIAIPIIIHLFNFRKFKKIYFSNVSFLREVKKESQSKSKLKHLLILASRILTITFLVLAFAQPFIPSVNSNQNINNIIGIYIDNSFSMESVGEHGTLLDEAKMKAIELLSSYQRTDKFIVFDNKFSAGSQRMLSNEEALTKIEEIKISPESRVLSTVFSRLNEALNSNSDENTNKSIVIFSDFQKSTIDLDKLKKDTLIHSVFVPILSTKKTNLYIDTCWFENPTHLLAQQEKLFVRIKNNSDQDLENIPIKLYINQKLITPASFSAKANDETVVELNYKNHTSGIQAGKIELQDSPVTLDDDFYFSYLIAENIETLEIFGENAQSNIKAIFSSDSLFHFTSSSVNQLDYSKIKQSSLIVLNSLKNVSSGLAASLKNFVENGGSLTIIPANDIDLSSYQSFASLLQINAFTDLDTSTIKISEVSYRHPLYASVFEGNPADNINLPTIKKHFKQSNQAVTYKNVLLKLKNNDPFLTAYKNKKGTIYLISGSLDDDAGNFSKHAIFVPTLYNMALQSQFNYSLFYTIGENESLTIPRVENEGALKIKQTDFELIPRIKSDAENTVIFTTEGINLAGNYLLESKKLNLGLAYNYNRLESDLTTYSMNELNDLVINYSLNTSIINAGSKTINAAFNEMKNGKKYWKLCVILALLFLAVEIALIKLFK